MSNIWIEQVAATWAGQHHPSGGRAGMRELVAEGQLWQVLLRIEAMPPDDRGRLTISFVERTAAALRIDAGDIEAYLSRADRPRGCHGDRG